MKKIIAILAAAAMVAATLSFAGCTEPADNADDNSEKVNTDVDADADADADANADANADADADADADANADADADADADSDALTTVTEGKLTMATNAYFPPYEYYDGDTIVGIDAEIAAAIAEKLGLELVINDMEFNSIITAVESGAADVGVAGITVTEDRLESVNFTSSYANGVQTIIVKEDSPIKTVDDLYAEGASYKIGVQLTTTGDTYATEDFGENNVVRYSNGNEAVLGLLGGDVDCVIIDNEPAKALANENEGLVILDTAYADEDYAICVSKENDALLESINVAIDELTADGTIDDIIAKYIK